MLLDVGSAAWMWGLQAHLLHARGLRRLRNTLAR